MAKGSRDTNEDVDTVIAVSSDEIKKARAAVVGGSLDDNTSTVDCHPLIIEESAELGSESGFVRKPKALVRVDLERKVNEDTETVSLVSEALPVGDEDIEDVDEVTAEPVVAAAAAAVVADAAKPDETDPTLKPVVGAKRPAKEAPADFDDETKTRQREAIREPQETKDVFTEPVAIDKAKMLAPPSRDQTMPMPIPGDIGGALETVPLPANLVQQVLQQVDARAAARAAGQPMPALVLQPPPPDPLAALKATAPSQQRVVADPPRRMGIEVAIAVFAFLVVAVPALYYMWIHFQD